MDLIVKSDLQRAFSLERELFGFLYNGMYKLEGLATFTTQDYCQRYQTFLNAIRDYHTTLARLHERGLFVRPDHFRTQTVRGDRSYELEILPTILMDGDGIVIVSKPFDDVIGVLNGSYGMKDEFDEGLVQKVESGAAVLGEAEDRVVSGTKYIHRVGDYFRSVILILDPKRYEELQTLDNQITYGIIGRSNQEGMMAEMSSLFGSPFFTEIRNLEVRIQQPKLLADKTPKPIPNLTLLRSTNKDTLAEVVATLF